MNEIEKLKKENEQLKKEIKGLKKSNLVAIIFTALVLIIQLVNMFA